MLALRRLRLLIALVLFSFAVASQGAEPVPLETVLQQHCTTLQWKDNQLTGPAAERLLADAKESQFFLIGEYHGGVEPAKITAALFRALQPFGYRHLAIEMGPVTTERLAALAAAPNGLEAIGQLSAANPFALAFDSWREEAALLTNAIHTVQPASGQRTVWGLDQEFIFSGRLHFARLVELAPTPAARAVAEEYRTKAIAGETAPLPKEGTAPLLLTMVPTDFDKLAAAFPTEGEAARLIAELRASAAIYQAWSHGGDGGYAANSDRAALMQRHFNAYYDQSIAAGEKTPRVLLKFGDTHMVRGRSFTDVYDLGNFLPTLAARDALRTYHLLLVARGGHINNVTPDNSSPAASQSEYKATDTEEGFDPDPFFAAAPKDAWALLDLRAVRSLLSAGRIKTNEVNTRMIWGFDGILIIPESHAATTFK